MPFRPASGARQRRSRQFVLVFVVLAVALSVLATVLILEGLGDEDFQEQLQELREEGK